MAAKKKKPAEHKFNVESYPYTICREQHVWVPYDAVIDNVKKLGYRIQRCDNCPTKRQTIISLRVSNGGATLSTSYRYPDDYRIPGGVTPAERGQIRLYNFLAEAGDEQA